MVTQAEVVSLVKGQNLTAAEAADRLGISRQGVYNHLRRAGLSTGRRGRPAKVDTAPPAALPTALPRATNGDVVEHIRIEIGDAVENIESQLALKKMEVETLEGQHRSLFNALTNLTG